MYIKIRVFLYAVFIYRFSKNTKESAKYIMHVFVILAVFSILLFSLVIMKRTYIAQLLGPAIPEPFGNRLNESLENMDTFLRPY